mgnify:CR=1 FL=1
MHISSNTIQKKKIAIATETVTTIAILTALSIICSMFLTIRGGTMMKFSPTFVIVALAARRYGPLGAGLVAFLSDLIQFFMFPSLGFSVGICLSGVLSGLLFGFIFYKKINMPRILLATVSTQVLCSLGITTLTMVYIERWFPLTPLLYFRLLQTAIMIPVTIIVLYLLFVKIDIAKLTKVVK